MLCMEKEHLYIGILRKGWKKVSFVRLDKILLHFKEIMNKLKYKVKIQQNKNLIDININFLYDLHMGCLKG